MTVQLSTATWDSADDMRHARDRVVSTLAEWQVTDVRCVEAVRLVVSELIGNAIRYGGAVVAVALDRQRDGVLVSVVDSSPSPPRQRLAHDDEETGRGLRLVEALTLRWGAEPRGAGKCVWALVPTTEQVVSAPSAG